MSFFRKLANDSLIVFCAQLLMQLKAFVLLPILTKTFGATNYGIWAQVSVLVGLLSPIVASGLDGANIRFLPGGSRNDIRERFFTNVIYVVCVSCIAFLLLGIFAVPIASTFFVSERSARFVVLVGAFLLFTSLQNTTINYFRIFLQIKTFSALIVAGAFGDLLVAVVVAALKYGVFELVLGLVGVRAILALVQIALIVKQIGFLWPQCRYLKEDLAFGLPLVPTAWVTWVLNMADRLFVSYYIGIAAVGIYSVNYNLGYALIGLFFSPIWITFPPLAAQLYNSKRTEELSRLCRYSTKYALMLMIPGIVGFSILSEPSMRILTTSEFSRGAYLAPWITLGYLFSMLGSYAGTGLELAKKTTWILAIQGVSAIVNLVLLILLIPPLGLMGAALSTTLAFLVQFLLSLMFGYQYMPFQWDVASIAKFLAASSIMAFILYLMPAQSLLEVSIAILVGGAVYVMGLVLLRSFSKQEKILIIRMFIPSHHGLFQKITPASKEYEAKD